jgi:hypothetical protein
MQIMPGAFFCTAIFDSGAGGSWVCRCDVWNLLRKCFKVFMKLKPLGIHPRYFKQKVNIQSTSLMQKYLYNYDDSYIHVADECSVDKAHGFTVDSYRFGRCHLFAQALSEAKGLPIGIFASMGEVAFVEGPCMLLVHAFCYLNEHEVIDVQGIRSKQDMLAAYDNGEGVFEISGDQALETIDSMKLFEPEDEAEKQALARHILQMQRHGLLKPGQLEEELYSHRRFF